MFESNEEEIPLENEELEEHQREKDTHRNRRKRKEQEKQHAKWKENKPRGKKNFLKSNWDDNDNF